MNYFTLNEILNEEITKIYEKLGQILGYATSNAGIQYDSNVGIALYNISAYLSCVSFGSFLNLNEPVK